LARGLRQGRIAAESGEAAAQFNLGVLYDSRIDDNGYAIEGDRAEAIKWLLAAAERGLPRAQSRLAELYADGPNASGNYVNARAWFLLAAASSRGIHRHQARSAYERVATRLTPAQLTKARRLAGLWRAQSSHGTSQLSEGKRNESLVCFTPRHSDFCRPADRSIRSLSRTLSSKLCEEGSGRCCSMQR
jgi:TPR repeat protein